MVPATPARSVLAPEWLPHRYDPGHDAIHFVKAERSLRRVVPFLTDEHLPHAKEPTVVRRADALRAAPAPAPLHFIFHSAYCCSTLLANALDVPGASLAYKEPQILNDLVGWRHRGGDPARIRDVLDTTLRLLARGFASSETAVVKPSNIVNGLASAALDLHPQARCILLHAPLRAFLVSIARKGMWGRLWVRQLLAAQLQDGLVELGFEPRDYLLHTDLQAAAVGWLAQQRLFSALVARQPTRVRTLNSDDLVRDPHRAIAAAAPWFGLKLSEGKIESIVEKVFSRNAKDGSDFKAGQRDADRRAGEELHAEEVDKVTAWAEAVARNASVALELPAPLISS